MISFFFSPCAHRIDVTEMLAASSEAWAALGKFPYKSVGCVFNHQSLFINTQPDPLSHSSEHDFPVPVSLSYNLSDPDAWASMDPDEIRDLVSLPHSIHLRVSAERARLPIKV